MSAAPVGCLRVESVPTDGAWNMAVDEAMLLDAIETGRTWLRLYRWSRPTLSLGYFQKPADLPDDPLLAGLPTVRRLSGGGAIVHDDELTYSCVVPPGHVFARDPVRLYEVVHQAVVRVLRDRRVNVSFRGTPDRGADSHFLCFSRGDERDLVLAGHKILGSAQRRRKGAVLQHGSLLVGASPHAPHLPGVRDLVPDFDESTLETALGGALTECLPGSFEQTNADDLEARARARAKEPGSRRSSPGPVV